MAGKGVYKVSEQDFWDFIERSGFAERFTIEIDSPYVGTLTKARVICADHGIHETISGDIMRTKHGCRKCGQKAIGASVTERMAGIPLESNWKTVEVFIAQLKLPEFITLDTSNFRAMKHGSVTTVCEHHGENVWTPPSTLKFSTYGCRECASEARRKNNTTDWLSFVALARARFGARFEYEDVYGYERLSSHIAIKCSLHGLQKMRASKHLGGQYCAECRMEDLKASGVLVGYVGEALEKDPELRTTPARIYYVQIGKLFKIGITWAKDPNSRFRAIRREAKQEITVLETIECTLEEAFNWEQKILKEFSEYRVTRSWSTELFDRDVLKTYGGLGGRLLLAEG